jgi:outer membrane lipoprotein carrier protein
MLKETVVALLSFLNVSPASAPAVAAQPAAHVARAEALDAAEVVKRVQSFYDKTNRLTAKFRQEYTNETFGKKTNSDGRVYIKKPGKMRWDYYEKIRGKHRKQQVKSFISDGRRLWAVEHDNKQVFKKNLKDDLLPVAITFLYGEGDLSRDFTAELDGKSGLGEAGEFVLKLTPKKPSAQYKTLWLVVSPDNFRVRRSVVLEASGNTNSFTFYEPDLKKPVADSWFSFNEKQYRSYRIVEPGANR